MACNCERKYEASEKLSENRHQKNIYMDYNATTPVLNPMPRRFCNIMPQKLGQPPSYTRPEQKRGKRL
jgi:hypothetical protein